MMALLFDGVDAHGRAVRFYVSAATRIDARTFRVDPGAVITQRVFGEPRGRGRPPRRWDVAVKAAGVITKGGHLRDAHAVVNDYRRATGKGELVDPREGLPEKPHYREAARWVKVGKQFQQSVRRNGYLEFSLRGTTWEAFLVKDGARRPASILLTGDPPQAATGRQKPRKKNG